MDDSEKEKNTFDWMNGAIFSLWTERVESVIHSQWSSRKNKQKRRARDTDKQMQMIGLSSQPKQSSPLEFFVHTNNQKSNREPQSPQEYNDWLAACIPKQCWPPTKPSNKIEDPQCNMNSTSTSPREPSWEFILDRGDEPQEWSLDDWNRWRGRYKSTNKDPSTQKDQDSQTCLRCTTEHQEVSE